MKEQDFGSSIGCQEVEGSGYAISEQDFGIDVKPGQLPDGRGGWTLY